MNKESKAENNAKTIQIKSTVPDIEQLLTLAVDKNASIDALEKLLAMRRELKEEQAREAFARDFAAFQGECPVITKSKAVMNKPSKGGGIRYHYAPLDDIVSQVQELLKKYGFSYTIQTINEKDPDGQRSVCTVHHIEGHSRSSEFWAPVDHEAYMSDQQKWAAASTYGKRYAFCNALGILTGDEDNDAQSLDDNQKHSKTQTTKSKTSQISVKSDEYLVLEKQIKLDIGNEHFTGEIRYKDQLWGLDDFKLQINEYLTQGIQSIKEMRTGANRVAEMLMIAEERDIDPEVQEKIENEGLLDDDNLEDIQGVFNGTIVDNEKEGNLSD